MKILYDFMDLYIVTGQGSGQTKYFSLLVDKVVNKGSLQPVQLIKDLD